MCRTSIFLISLMILAGCSDHAPRENNSKPTQEQLVEINRQLAIKDQERIKSYIERKGLEMTQTESGMWYEITEEGSGEVAADGMKITLSYECSMLDGTLLYSSEKDGEMKFEVGGEAPVRGLDEGARFLRYGSEATFIFPSYLAYGLTGDQKRVPAKAILVYKVKVTDLSR